MVHTALAIMEGYKGIGETCAVCLKIWVEGAEFRMAVVDSVQSPWREESYLGRIMDRADAMEHPYLSHFFHIVDHVNFSNPTINGYFDN
jgi:hypothetical protein